METTHTGIHPHTANVRDTKGPRPSGAASACGRSGPTGFLVQKTFQQGHPVVAEIARARCRSLHGAHKELAETLALGAPDQQLHSLRRVYQCQRQDGARGLVPRKVRVSAGPPCPI